MVMTSFNCQLGTVWNHLDRVSVRDCLDWSGLRTYLRGIFLVWLIGAILNVSILTSWAGHWTICKVRRWAEYKHACVPLLCSWRWVCCDPVTKAPATAAMEHNVKLWAQPFLPYIILVRAFYYSNRTVTIIVSFCDSKREWEGSLANHTVTQF